MHSPRTEFALLTRLPDEALDLERLAVSIARMGDPPAELAAVGARLDELAERVSDAVDLGAPPDRLAAALARTIGGSLGFRGSSNSFATPEGSYLHAVLERRDGLPILVAVVWILLGKRLGLPIRGVNFPGHFLACLDAPGARIYVDPWRGGAPREVDTLIAQLGPGDRRALEPAGVRPIVARMLTNLKNLWVDGGDYTRALEAVDRILLIAGERPQEVRDRGLLCIHAGRRAEGVRDLERYLTLVPEAADTAEVRAVLVGRR